MTIQYDEPVKATVKQTELTPGREKKRRFEYLSSLFWMRTLIVSLVILGSITFFFLLITAIKKNGEDMCRRLSEYQALSNSSKVAAYESFRSIQSYNPQTQTEILVLIITAPDNFEFRSQLRNEGYLTHKWKYTFKDTFKVHYSFVCGSTTNTTLLSEMRGEAKQYGDLLIGDYLDTYENLVYKTIWLLRYAITGYRFDFVLKVDDDTFLNQQLLYDFLYKYIKPKYNDKHLGYYGGMIRHGSREVQRDGQWGIATWEYQEDILPPYHVGGAYIMNYRAAKQIIDLNAANVMVAFRIEDAYIGALANRLGMVPRNIPKAYSKEYDRFCGDKGGKIFHRVAPSFQVKMLQNWTTMGYYCPKDQVKSLQEIIDAGEELLRKY